MTPIMCMATAIFFEARDQPITGQEMVADVVLNRVEHERFPDTVCDVVYQDSAFSFTLVPHNIDDHREPADVVAKVLAIALAKDYIDGSNRLGITSTHYHTLEVLPYWSTSFTVDGVVGDHVFYTCSDYC